MKIMLHYKGFTRIEKYKSGSVIEVPDKCTVRDLITLLGINKQVYIVVNNEPAWNSMVLKENDSVKLYQMVSGG